MVLLSLNVNNVRAVQRQIRNLLIDKNILECSSLETETRLAEAIAG